MQHILGLGKELYRTIAVFCVGALGIGFLMGILYHSWITAPVELPKQQATSVQTPPQPSSANPFPFCNPITHVRSTERDSVPLHMTICVGLRQQKHGKIENWRRPGCLSEPKLTLCLY